MTISRINYRVSGSRTGDSVWRASYTNMFNQLEIINPSLGMGEKGRYAPVVNTLVETVTLSPQEPHNIDQTVDLSHLKWPMEKSHRGQGLTVISHKISITSVRPDFRYFALSFHFLGNF